MTRYRIFLEQAHYASSTINLRLAAVRRLAYEADDSGLLSPDLAAGIRRVKGAKKRGTRVGNWLTPEQGRALLFSFESRDTQWQARLRHGCRPTRMWNFDEPSWLRPKSQTCSNVKNTGCSPT